MAKETKVCRVCGKAYTACRTLNTSNVFRWQDVSCSPECGAEYLRKIRLSRESNTAEQSVMYNEDYNGFYGKLEDEYINEFGSDE